MDAQAHRFDNKVDHVGNFVQIGQVSGGQITIVDGRGRERVVPFLAPPPGAKRLVGRAGSLEKLRCILCDARKPDGEGRRDNGSRDGRPVPTCMVTGAVGVGKTTLAATAAYDPLVLTRFDDGVLWAGLGSHPDLLACLAEWGRAVGVPQDLIAAETDPAKRAVLVQNHIGNRAMLLVVDDVWSESHLQVFTQIGGPKCGRLFTTRFRRIAVNLAADAIEELGDLQPAEAVELLAAHAPAVVENDAVKQATVKFVETLGRLPLSVTLIGNYLALPALVGPGRMTDALQALEAAMKRARPEAGTGPLPPRPTDPDYVPQTLYAAIRATDEVLEAPARQSLRCLTVFPPKPNSFSRRAAIAVADDGGKPIDDLFDLGLLEIAGADRFSMHPSIRAYALNGDRALRKAADKARKRMIDHFIEYVHARPGGSTELLHDHANILAALELAHEHNMRAMLVRCVNAFFDFLEAQGLYAGAKARTYFDHARQVAESVKDPCLRASTYLVLARLAEKQGDLGESGRLLRQALTLVRPVAGGGGGGGGKNNVRLCSEVWLAAGLLRLTRARYDAANRALKRALAFALKEKTLDHRHLSTICKRLGQVALPQHAFEVADGHLAEALAYAEKQADAEHIVGVLVPAGWVAFNRGRMDEAGAFAMKGLNLLKQHRLAHREHTVALLHLAAAAAHNRGELQAAEAYAEEGLRGANEISHKWYLSAIRSEFGEIHLKGGKLAEAERAFRDAQDVAPPGSMDRSAFALYGRARVVARDGRPGEARQLAEGARDSFRAQRHGHAVNVQRWLDHGLPLEEGEAHLHRGDLKQARDVFQRLAAAPGADAHTLAACAFGLARAAGVDQPDEAERQALASAELFKRFDPWRARAVRGWLATMLIALGKRRLSEFAHELAIQTFDRARAAASDWPSLQAEACLGIAQTMAAMKRPQDEREWADRAAEICKLHHLPLLARAQAWQTIVPGLDDGPAEAGLGSGDIERPTSAPPIGHAIVHPAAGNDSLVDPAIPGDKN